jgi:AraC-like DNA-binding protein
MLYVVAGSQSTPNKSIWHFHTAIHTHYVTSRQTFRTLLGTSPVFSKLTKFDFKQAMLYIVGITITFFLVVVLSSKKDKSTADKILTCWLFFIGLHLLLFYLNVTKKNIEYPFLLGWEIPIPLLHGPFLFLYTNALTKQNQNKKIYLLHFLPFVLTLVSLLPFFLLTPQQKIIVYQNEGAEYATLMAVIYSGILLSGVLYTLLSMLKLEKHRRTIADQFSFTEKINLKWLSYLAAGSTIIWLLVIFSDDQYVFSAIVIYVIFIGYFGIKQVGIFTNRTHLEDEPSITLPIHEPRINSPLVEKPEKEKIKYEKSGLTQEELQSIHKNLKEVMQNEKLFKNPELTLAELAQRINTHANTLSQVINSIEQKTFYDYINLLRIEEFKKEVSLSENQKFTLLSLAFECGFNSKTSFNRNFKKATNLSPTEFLKKENINMQ